MPKDWGKLKGVRPIKLLYYLAQEGYGHSQMQEYLVKNEKLNRETAVLLTNLFKLEEVVFRDFPRNSASIYVHIPFCPSRCTYCSFVSKSNFHKSDLLEKYIKYLLIEIEHLGEYIEKSNIEVFSIYVGGGTPTVVNETMFASILKKIRGLFKEEVEFTIEAGRPNTISKEKLDLMKDYGVTRVCINPQTMNNKTLVKVNRKHTADDIVKAVKLANRYNIKVNMDMIVGLPQEQNQDIIYTLENILKLSPDEITVHSLAIKRASEITDLKRRASIEIYDEIEKRLLTNYQPYYLYKQRNTLYNQANIGYTKHDPCLYNMAMINEQFSVLACGAGAITKILDDNKQFTRFNGPKDVKLYLDKFDEFIERKIRWFENAK